MVACLAVTSHQNPNASVIARLSRGFLPHRQFGFSRLEAGGGAGPVRASDEQRRGLLRSAPRGIAMDRQL